ncbi:MAG: M42 family metallopeptidase [Ruminococcaceae bacterium]|nr:M42 family metallopeptidase [Oscillospiraceae bacterium]
MLDGVSGNEGAVREYIKAQIQSYCDFLVEDSLGNLIALKKGAGRKKVMLCAHMDEVGFIVSHVMEDGFCRVKPVGGYDNRILAGQRVRVGEQKYPAVFGLKAAHHTTLEERKNELNFGDMYLDVGTAVKRGEYVSFDSEYLEFGDRKAKGKALDDRVGCAALIGLLQADQVYSYDLYVCFSVQEEVGLRGAKVLANRIRPDFAMAVEATTCSDLTGVPYEFVTELGKGPAVSVADGASYSNADYRELMIKTAEKMNLPIQLKKSTTGGNDAGALQLYGRGCATMVFSLPCRYIHSPCSVIDLDDYQAYCQLLKGFMEELEGVL